MPEPFVIGDTAHVAIEGKPVPGVAPGAKQQGAYVAKALQPVSWGAPCQGPSHIATWTTSRPWAAARVIDFGRLQLTGWLASGFGTLHIYFLIGAHSRLTMAISWLWSLLSGHNSGHLIT